MSEAAVSNMLEAEPGSRKMTNSSAIPRISEIDGIRGWAALAVVIFHALPETFGNLHPGVFSSPLIWFFIDGPLAVCIFFILSGDALSTPTMSTHRRRVLDKMVMKRYFRLVAPIFITTLITAITIRLGLTFNIEASEIVHKETWLGRFVPHDFRLIEALRFPFLTVFEPGGSDRFNAFLWTMPIELVGSVFVFVYLYVHHRLKHPQLVIVALIAAFCISSQWYALFFMGVLLSHLRASGVLDKMRSAPAGRLAGPALVLIAYLLEYYLRVSVPLHSATTPKESVILLLQNNEKIIMAALFVTGANMSIDLCRLFRSSLSTFLGTVSFPIYLMQIVVFCTLSSFLITKLAARIDDSLTCFWIGLVGVSATLVCGYALSIIERHVMRIIDAAVVRLVKD